MANWKKLDEMSILSGRYPRLDGAAKVSGSAQYTYDLKLEGMLYGAILGSPYPAAKLIRIDDSKVRRLPGVRAVLIDVHPTGTLRYPGEEVAAVAADSPEILADALELFEVTYEPAPFAIDTETARKPDAPRVFADRENMREADVQQEGDPEAGFAAAEVTVEAQYHTQVQVHTPLEVHGSVAKWDGDQLTIWDSTQAVHGVREGIAKTLEIPLANVRVICHHMGGGFGAKLQPGRYTAIAARLAREAGAPVKLMLSRKDEFLNSGNRPDSIQELKLGATRDGKITAFSATTYGTAGIGTGAGVRLPIVYEIPNFHRTHYDVFTNGCPARPFRAPGCPQAVFAMDQIMDEMAEKLGMDSLEFRLKNDPSATRREEWRLGAAKIGWAARNKVAGSDPGPLKRGIGMGASIWWPGGRGTKAAMTIYPDGNVEVRCGTQDIGTGTRTYVASIAAEELGIDMSKIRPLIGDSDYPRSGASGGSTTAPSVAPAIKNTAENARRELTALAAQQLGVAPETIEWSGSSLNVKDRKSRQLNWVEVCSLLDTDPLEVHGEWVEGLSSAGVAGCQFAEVLVDTATGRVEVKKVVAVADCGLILNRLTTESQINGGVIQGVSYALFEERLLDPHTGLMVNPNYESYKIVGALETPEIEIVLYDEPERGVIGIGEPPTIPTAGAIANAVYNAIGIRMRELPITPDKVLNALARG